MSAKLSSLSKRRIKKAFAAFISLIFALLLIIVPTPALSGARDGLTLCGSTVIPSLFPFLVVSAFIIGTGLGDNLGRLFESLLQKVFRISGNAAAPIILGAIGGYPVGASAVFQLCKGGSLTKKESERLLCFAINSSPAFIIGAVGAGFLKSPTAGVLLYIAHLLTSFTIGLILRPRKKSYLKTQTNRKKVVSDIPPSKPKGLAEAFVGSVTSSAKSIITICAFVVLFSSVNSLFKETGTITVISNFLSLILPDVKGDSFFYSRIVTSILEVTNGCAAAAGSGSLRAVLLSAAALGFSGLSVQFQVISLVKGSGISTKAFILTRFLHAAISVIFAFILFSIFPSAVPTIPCTEVFAVQISGVTATVHSAPSVFAMLILMGLLLLSAAAI